MISTQILARDELGQHRLPSHVLSAPSHGEWRAWLCMHSAGRRAQLQWWAGPPRSLQQPLCLAAPAGRCTGKVMESCTLIQLAMARRRLTCHSCGIVLVSHCSMPLLVQPSLKSAVADKSGNSTYCSVSRLSRNSASPRARRSWILVTSFLILHQHTTACKPV